MIMAHSCSLLAKGRRQPKACAGRCLLPVAKLRWIVTWSITFQLHWMVKASEGVVGLSSFLNRTLGLNQPCPFGPSDQTPQQIANENMCSLKPPTKNHPCHLLCRP